jgi:signal peptidase
MPRAAKPSWAFAILAALAGGAIAASAEEGLFVSKPLTPKGEYTFQIEGPAVDGAGNLYVGNLAIKDDPKNGGAIGRVKVGDKKSSVLAILPVSKVGTKLVKSKTSGIRFDRDGRMYATDFNNHNIFVFEPGQPAPKVYFTTNGTNGPKFNQPNDLAIAKDGTLYASDPNFGNNTGRVWRIARDAQGKVSGAIMTAPDMGTTNGLDLSPDDKNLYVAESNTKKVQAYRIEGTTLVFEGTIKTLPEGDPDGLRTDAQGRIYVAQNGGQKITRFRPDGSEAKSIDTNGAKPSNLTFGGPDGKTVFVTQVDGGFIESFRVDVPGREFCKPFTETAC